MLSNVEEGYKALRLISPQAVTADALTPTGVDVEKYEGDCMVTVVVGAVTGTAPTADITIEGSIDGTTYPDTLATFAQLTGTDDDKIACQTIDVTKYKKIRAPIDVGGTTPSFELCITAHVRSSQQGADLNPGTFE